MIITKTYLKQIIKEELEKVRLEQIEIVGEEQLQEGPLKKFLSGLALAGSLLGIGGVSTAKADPMKVKMHYRLSGDSYVDTIDIPGAKAGMDPFELQAITQKYIDNVIKTKADKAKAAGLEPKGEEGSFVVDEVTPVPSAPKAASQTGTVSAQDASSVTFDDESGFYKVVIPAKDKNKKEAAVLAALQRHLNKPNARYDGPMFPEKSSKPGTITILVNPAGIK
jgi:hypothetical protein